LRTEIRTERAGGSDEEFEEGGSSMAETQERETMIHVRFEGRSWDVPAGALALSRESTDAEVKAALAGHLDVALDRLAPYVVERHETGNLTLRPEAIFG
jgi:hypothetical protein